MHKDKTLSNVHFYEPQMCYTFMMIELESISETIHKYMEAHEELKTLSIVCEFDKLMAEK